MLSSSPNSYAQSFGLCETGGTLLGRIGDERRMTMRFTRTLLVSFACIAAFAASPSFAQSNDEDALRHFEAGVSYFNTSDYEDALREFKRSYQLADLPRRSAILLNMAAAYERMGDLEKTIETLEQYLRETPEPSDRNTVELRITNLKERVDKQEEARREQAPAVESKPEPPPTEEKPDYTFAYVSWGVGGAAALGSLVTGLMANSRYHDKKDGCGSTPAGCSDDDIRGVRSLAWVSTGLTGLALVGVGVGTVLYLTAEPSRQESVSRWTPSIQAGWVPTGGAVQAQWAF